MWGMYLWYVLQFININSYSRVREFGDADKSQQLILQATNTEGARTIEGTYLCQVTKNIGGSVMINRTIDIYMHGEWL